MTICPTLNFSFPDTEEGSSLSQSQVLNSNLASMRRLEIVGDHLEGLIDSPHRQRA